MKSRLLEAGCRYGATNVMYDVGTSGLEYGELISRFRLHCLARGRIGLIICLYYRIQQINGTTNARSFSYILPYAFAGPSTTFLTLASKASIIFSATFGAAA